MRARSKQIYQHIPLQPSLGEPDKVVGEDVLLDTGCVAPWICTLRTLSPSLRLPLIGMRALFGLSVAVSFLALTTSASGVDVW